MRPHLPYFHTRIRTRARGSGLLLLVGSVAGLTAFAAPARADVKLPAVLADHMVLQQGMNVPVWGTAEAGEDITVSFGPQKQTAKAGANGKWAVKLSPLAASDKPAELVVAGRNTVTLKDVLVGEVWICSGQSNMEWPLRQARDAKKEIEEASYPAIRLFTVLKKTSDEPLSDVAPAPRNQAWQNQWAACGPDTAGTFSAVGYFFGREVQHQLNVPVGLIHTSWGGTVAEAWTPRATLEADPDFKPILDRARIVPGDYEKKLTAWEEAAAKAKADGQNPPGRPGDPKADPNRAAVLYNGMVSPVVPVAARGVIWYQGEGNAGRAAQYRKLLPAMIGSWRQAFGQPELAFHIVQLANFQAPPTEPAATDDWAELREAQWLTAQQPHNGIALAIDLADSDNPGDIHPKNKQDVGRRLALVALAKTYGKGVAYSGPVFDAMKADGDKARLTFKFADGLAAKGGDTVKGFQVAGEDRKWHWADAKIEGGAVVVSSGDVTKPAAVRYDWAHNPQGNLYNAAGLPAAPFRTDDWPGVTDGKK